MKFILQVNYTIFIAGIFIENESPKLIKIDKNES